MMKQRERLDAIGKKILGETRSRLYLAMPFLGAAFGSLDFRMDLLTRTMGTDGVYIRFNPLFLTQAYMERRKELVRGYLHSLLHCVFGHIYSYKQKTDRQLYDICTDIAVEWLVDSMDTQVLMEVPRDFRLECYQEWESELGILSAERLYQYFLKNQVGGAFQMRLAAEFVRDDHCFWPKIPDEPENPQQNPDLPLQVREREEAWNKTSKRTLSELLLRGKENSGEYGCLERILRAEHRQRRDYRTFLQQFAVLREEARMDPETFDYGFYHYGMQVYGNMPLIEENEYCESRKVEELVIAIDTSASCEGPRVQEFLNETATMLMQMECFFERVQIRILECDNKVQQDIPIHNGKEIRRYAEHFSVKGGYGTDFRPVFSYVEQLQQRGELAGLKGLVYFTDGQGTFQETPTRYETAFVMSRDDDAEEVRVPEWALKLYLDELSQ